MSNFQKYSAYYDLLYQDKDYDAEAAYVARRLREFQPDTRSLLELGSGTGRHGRRLAALGFDIHGVERSDEMVAAAEDAKEGLSSGTFTCQVGDVCTAQLGRTYDAVISLFHVISYQTTNEALGAVFRNAADHLLPGGLFLFDVWHGPAVLAQQPERRIKDVASAQHRVRRIAEPELDTNASTVNVIYHMDCEDLSTGEKLAFREDHLMRYLFPTEIDFFTQANGMRRLKTEEFLTGRAPSTMTWGVSYLLQRNG